MSFTTYTTIWCDAKDCLNWIGQEDTAAEARKLGKIYGWKRVAGKDLCPEHVKCLR